MLKTGKFIVGNQEWTVRPVSKSKQTSHAGTTPNIPGTELQPEVNGEASKLQLLPQEQEEKDECYDALFDDIIQGMIGNFADPSVSWDEIEEKVQQASEACKRRVALKQLK